MMNSVPFRFWLAGCLVFSACLSSDSFAQNEGAPIVPPQPLSQFGEIAEGEEPDSWWGSFVENPIGSEDKSYRITLEDLLIRSLTHSSQIKVFSELPLIRETSIIEADSAFDWTAFLDARWDDISDPVGNTLTVGGGGTRFLDEKFDASVGVRKRTRTGGRLELAQRFGHQTNNSTFFVPNRQGTSRLVLSYTQPLKRGRGQLYNESLTVLAEIDTSIANDEFNRQLQSHLLEVVRSYWGLYLERGIFAQKARAYKRAQSVYDRLQRRREIDAFESQLISAEAEVKSRRSQLRRSLAAIKNAEDRIRSLVNDPVLEHEGLELIPVDSPTSMLHSVSMDEALSTAVQFRPEISQALKQIQAACVRTNMSKNELMPVLNLVTEAYVSGLQGNGDIGGAWGDQFNTGQLSYSVGLQYEVPLYNRAAKVRHTRRHLELRQIQNQYATTVSTLKLETLVSVREVQTSFDELDSKLAALKAMRAKTDYILRRWELMPGEGRSGSYVLEDLLAAQSQLARAESEYLTSIVTYNLALMNLKKSTGMLLQHEQVIIGRTYMDHLPTQILDKPYTGTIVEGAQPVEMGHDLPAGQGVEEPYILENDPIAP